MQNKKILVVEDDLSLGFLLLESLEEAGYQVKLSKCGSTGWERFQKEQFDLCILDVMMPEMDGFMLARKIRAKDQATPFLFLTARSMKEDKIKGFNLGAEDYVTKPFEEEELLCRIDVILRRAKNTNLPKCPKFQFQIGDYFFDYKRQELSYKENTKRLTEKENEILHLLCLNQNEILRRDDAVEQIYGERDYFLGRSFDVFISRLRKMLKHDPRIKIENVFKVGFILQVHSPEAKE